MNIKRLTEKDKRSLVVLGLFLALAGYYHFVFEPVFTRWKAADKVISTKKKELKQIEKKLREYRGILRDRDEFAARASLVVARVKMPPLGTSQHEVLRAIMAAAGRSDVRIINVRPVAAPDSDGNTGVKAFAVEGNARSGQFVDFMERLWGMKIEELSLSATDDQARPIHFYTMLSLLPVAGIHSPATQVKVARFTLRQDPFRPGEQSSAGVSKEMNARMAAVFHLPVVTELPASPPEPTFSMAGLRLVGITSIDGKPGAIVIDDSQGGRELYLEVGDRIKDRVVSGIDAKGVTLKLNGAQDGRVDFPPRSGFDLPVSETAPKAVIPQAAPKSGRLGLQVMTVSADTASQKDLPVKEGLLVTRGRGDVPEVRINDIITSINGLKVPSLNEAKKIMHTIKAGDDLELEVIGNGEAKKVKIKAVE